MQEVMQSMRKASLAVRPLGLCARGLQAGNHFLELRAAGTVAKSQQESVHGSPRWGPVGIPEGARYAVWSRLTGACEQLDGPQLFWSAGSRIEPLTLHSAGPDEYLTVSHRGGNVEYMSGPASIWEDPVRHTQVQVSKSLPVASNEAIVIYREEANMDGTPNGIQRFILKGPVLHAPAGLEWLHTFVWHGTAQDSLKKSVQVKAPGALRFQKLRLTPDQIYFDVPNVRTRDDALLTMRVMIFTQLENIEQMLDATLDPISEFMNSLGADVIDFAGSRTFENFKTEMEALNLIGTYPKLMSRAGGIGYKISKVVFRGYESSTRIQEMHDEAIQKRTELVLQKETQEQEQDLRDFKLDRDSDRAERLADFKLRRAQERQAIEKERVEHQEKIQDVQSNAKLQRDLRTHEQSLTIETNECAQRLSQQRDEHAQAEAHYAALQGLGVDLSRYLSVMARGPSQRVIEVDTGISGSTVPQLHIHSEDTKTGHD